MRPTAIALVQVGALLSPGAVATACATAGNVGAVTGETEDEPAERVRRAWERIDRRQSTYVLTDADPYEPLRDAFVASWRSERLEDFEIAALEAAPAPVPDFYFVLDDGRPDDDTHGERFLAREWYFGLLGRLTPNRVLPLAVPDDADASARLVLDRLAHLPMGPPLPSVQELVSQVRRSAPGVLAASDREPVRLL